MKPLYNNIGRKVIIKYLSSDICNELYFKQFLNGMGVILNVISNHYYRVELFGFRLTELFRPEELLILDESKKGNTFDF